MRSFNPPSIEAAPFPLEIQSHFKDHLWTNSLFSDASLIPMYSLDRLVVPRHGNYFISQTLNNESTLSQMAFYQPSSKRSPRLGELLCLSSLAYGVSGHANTLHGGVAAVLFDEVIGVLAALTLGHERLYTAILTTKYKKPVPAARNAVLCRSWVDEERSQGRKVWVHAILEDGTGTVMCEGESLYIEVDNMAKL
ncbi:MAG: hypothetical protein M1814_005204 [Vezdaea aestivalis]|nr:MAG: hypothetical protein M1814_005204 [Vezdaea aestivalis]